MNTLSASARARRDAFAITLAASLLLAACGDDTTTTRPDGGPQPDQALVDGPAPNAQLTFVRKEVLDPNKAGRYAWIARNGSSLGIAYFRIEGKEEDQPCPPSGTAQKRPIQEIYYTQFDGTDWSAPTVVVKTVGPPFGLSLTYDGSGNPAVGYLGGALSVRECSSSDAAISRSTDGGKTWSEQVVAGAGTAGDTVGLWMSVATDPSGQVQSAYRDVQFGYYTADGDRRADLRFGSGAEGVAVDQGDGVFAHLLYTPDGTPVISAHNAVDETVANRGLKLFRKDSTGAWLSSTVLAGATRERPGFATDGNGLFGIAYFKPSDGSLFYVETTDLTSFTPAKLVDFSTSTHGEYASLAFDSKGNPAVSYYRCAGPGETSCDPQADALMFAYRLNGTWKVYEVDDGGANFCGRYTSLTFDDKDQPVIAYQCVALDNTTNTFPDTLKVAHGVWK